MLFLVVGLILLVMFFMDIAPVSTWKWYWLAVPFALAWIWWDVIDPMFSLSKKQEVKNFEARKKARLEKARDALGLGTKGRGKK